MVDIVRGNISSSSGTSWQHTISTGDARILIVGGATYQGDITGITWRGTALTKKIEAESNSHISEIWYLLDPETGVGTIIVSGSGWNKYGSGAVDYRNVNTISPWGSTTFDTSEAGSVNIYCSGKGVIIDVLKEYPDEPTPSTFQTLLWKVNEGFSNWGGSSDRAISSSGTYPMSWDHGVSMVAAFLKSRELYEFTYFENITLAETPTFGLFRTLFESLSNSELLSKVLSPYTGITEGTLSYFSGIEGSLNTWTHNVLDNVHGVKILVISVVCNDTYGVYFNDQYCTKTVERANTNDIFAYVAMWTVLDPPSGIGTITVRGSGMNKFTGGALDYGGCSSDLSNTISAEVYGNTISCTLTSSSTQNILLDTFYASDLVYDWLCNHISIVGLGNQVWKHGIAKDYPSVGENTLTWTWNPASNVVQVALELKPNAIWGEHLYTETCTLAISLLLEIDKVLEESLSFIDYIGKQIVKSWTEVLAIMDEVFWSNYLLKEVISIVDSFTKTWSANKTLDETISIVDTPSKLIQKVLAYLIEHLEGVG